MPTFAPPRPPYHNPDVRCGRFLMVTPTVPVYCGICREDFEVPAHKAEHLRSDHGAVIGSMVNTVGADEFTWRLR